MRLQKANSGRGAGEVCTGRTGAPRRCARHTTGVPRGRTTTTRDRPRGKGDATPAPREERPAAELKLPADMIVYDGASTTVTPALSRPSFFFFAGRFQLFVEREGSSRDMNL